MKIPDTLILSRDLSAAVLALEVPAGLELLRLGNVADPGVAVLEQLCSENGFPGGWVAGMLARGCRATVAVREGRAVAGAWCTSGPLFIDEIAREFMPPSQGDYFFGDLVAPQARGAGLQRLLIRARLIDSAAAGQRWATAMMFQDNPASVKSYRRESFATAATWGGWRWGRWRFERLRAVPGAAPCGSFGAKGAFQFVRAV
jgi:hypothetical protein